MPEYLKLDPNKLTRIRSIDHQVVAYNIEMTEVTGGTFWKAYTPEQVEGTKPFPHIADWQNMNNLQQYYDPIDLSNPRLRKLAKALGRTWVRVSGTWANKTYYDFNGHTNGVAPEGFQNVLTKKQWAGLLDFVKAVDGKLLVSVANCPGIHEANIAWNPEQAEVLFRFSQEYGVPISAAEFTNEPNMMSFSGLPVGYTPENHARDHALFGQWLRENYPDCIFVGPCTVGDVEMNLNGESIGGGIASALELVTTEALMGNTQILPEIFSYHYYNGVSERGAAMGGHWPYEKCMSEEYLAVAGSCARQYLERRDRYSTSGQLWVTESGDAGCGGNTWASTYADVVRSLNELGDFCTVSDGVIFHNTLASSDYGYLQHGTFEPRPNYYAVLLWNQLMGDVVYNAGEKLREGAHVYAHSRKDGQSGAVYLVINNSKTEVTRVELPKDFTQYVLSGDGHLRSRGICLNGQPLHLENDVLPSLCGRPQRAGTVKLDPGSCAFFVL